jgi:hypothetical protein
MYVEPGGYYEYDAEYTKPIVAGVDDGSATRAVGHAGDVWRQRRCCRLSAGSWTFGVDGIFTPQRRRSRRGAPS